MDIREAASRPSVSPDEAIALFQFDRTGLLPKRCNPTPQTSLWLCHRIAYSRFQWEQDLSDFNMTLLNVAVTRRQITPLHVAALVGELSIVQRLVTLGATSRADNQGWHPSHFAATCRHETVCAWLLEKFGDSQTSQGLSVSAIRYWLELPRPAQAAPALWERTQAVFVNRLYAEPPAIASIYVSNASRESRSVPRHAWYAQSSPQLCLVDEKIKEAGLGVCAGERIPNGWFVGHYHGLVGTIRNRSSDNSYLLEKVDAAWVRGITAHINHGFPNVAFGSQSVDGIDCSYVQAITDIQEGERIYVDYGDRYTHLFSECCCELNPDGLTEFFTKNSLAEYRVSESDKGTLHEAGFRYIGHTPTAVLKLLQSEVVPACDLRVLFTNNSYWQGRSTPNAVRQEMLRWLDALDKLPHQELALVEKDVAAYSAEAVRLTLNWRQADPVRRDNWRSLLPLVKSACLCLHKEEAWDDLLFRFSGMKNGTEDIEGLPELCKEITQSRLSGHIFT